jgi:hypothetical protein
MRRAWAAIQQMLGVLVMTLLVSIVAHKALHDISIIADKHSGAAFWQALGKYFIGNIAGGKGP